MEIIKRENVKLRKARQKLNYDKVAEAVKAQNLDKAHVLGITSKEMEKLLGTKHEDRKSKTTLARTLRKKIGFDCMFDEENNRYVVSILE